jgi:hypothetical protein
MPRSTRVFPFSDVYLRIFIFAVASSNEQELLVSKYFGITNN